MKTYLNELKKRFSKYRATWVPDKQVKIGWIGTLEDNVFTLRSTLDDENIPYTVVVDESESDWDYESEGASTVTAKLAGQATPPNSQLGEADAGFTVQFNREKATVLKLTDVKVHQILNLANIERAVVQKFRDRDWKKDWVIVNEVVEAGSGTVIISDSKDGKIELKAAASVQNLDESDLGKAELGLGVVFKKGVGFKVIGKRGMTPMFRCVGLKRRALVPKAVGAPDPFEEMLDAGEIFEAQNDVEE